MSAIFDFSSLITVLLLAICTTAYLRELRPGIFDTAKEDHQPAGKQKREGVAGFLWKLSRIGERLSPYIGAACAVQAVTILFFK